MGQMQFKLLQKESLKGQQKQPLIWLVIKFLTKPQMLQKINSNILLRKLQMSIIKKYLKKDMYLQKKGKKNIDELTLK